jgi:hypothetical protein
MALTPLNYNQGFLIDEELMAGVTETTEQPGTFTAYVLRHTTGEYLGHQPGLPLDEALGMINQIPREWAFESTKSCDGTKCAEGKCKGQGCKVFDKDAAARRQASAPGVPKACESPVPAREY